MRASADAASRRPTAFALLLLQAPCSYDDPESCGHPAGAARITEADAAKSEWPELMGTPAREARTVIEAERPELSVQASAGAARRAAATIALGAGADAE